MWEPRRLKILCASMVFTRTVSRLILRFSCSMQHVTSSWMSVEHSTGEHDSSHLCVQFPWIQLRLILSTCYSTRGTRVTRDYTLNVTSSWISVEQSTGEHDSSHLCVQFPWIQLRLILSTCYSTRGTHVTQDYTLNVTSSWMSVEQSTGEHDSSHLCVQFPRIQLRLILSTCYSTRGTHVTRDYTLNTYVVEFESSGKAA
jgi:hypothetical protein